MDAHLAPEKADSSFLYESMDSQSERCLPVLYQDFDGRNRRHFADRGRILDFLSVLGGGRILDFGPGDGWPSLPLAPHVREVVGVDCCERRVSTCSANASRLGIGNAGFLKTEPGAPLPFSDHSFDGAAAASSIEQTPDPPATLCELARVLRPGGRLRLTFESLDMHGEELEELYLTGAPDGPATLVATRRFPDRERAVQYGLRLDCPRDVACDVLGGRRPSFEALNKAVLEQLRPRIVEAVTWTTLHPFASTMLDWLTKAGFSDAVPTHNGGSYAGAVFDGLDAGQIPPDTSGVDALLAPGVGAVCRLEAPSGRSRGERAPWITAVR